MLKLLYTSHVVACYDVDPGAIFHAGQIAGLITIGHSVLCTVSDGQTILPIGILDGYNTTSMYATVLFEKHIVEASVILENNIYICAKDIRVDLNEENILDKTFVCNLNVILNPKKGYIIIKKGTPVNFETQDGKMGFEIICSYRYMVVGQPGLRTIDGSGKVAIHFQRGIYETDMYDITALPLTPGAPLYVNNDGMLTARDTGSSVVAIATNIPNAVNNLLQFMWL